MRSPSPVQAQALAVPQVDSRHGLVALPEVRWAAAATALFLVAAGAGALGAPAVLVGAAYVACYASGGWGPAREGLRALRHRTLDVDLLMIVAALGAAAIGQTFDGALLIVIFATSGALESAATKRTRDSVRGLLALAPEQASRLRGDGTEEIVAAQQLVVADVIVVRPGERVGADGVVVGGASEVDEATITGEAMPVAKEPGDGVFAGTLNGTGMLRVRVERAAADSVVARIVALVEAASATKARTQLFIEKVEQRYSVAVVAATVGVFAVPFAFGAALQPTLLRAMTFMIVASPCAVVLATMPPLLSAIANAGRHGVLVKSAVVMERLSSVDVVAFDKTGTLTEGTPRVAAVEPIGDRFDADELLSLAAGAEGPSEHPLARAVTAAARDRGVEPPAAEDFSSQPGRGVAAVVAGHRVEVGQGALRDGLEGRDEARRRLALVDARGHTAVLVAVDGRAAGVLALADRSRPPARASVDGLRKATGRVPVLLTGDGHGPAGRLAAEVGIDDVRAGLLPGGKVDAVRELQAAGRRVLFVGDGVNDAPALAAADLGAAMHGADLALETADLVLVGDDLIAVPAIIGLSRRARRVVAQNLVFAGTAILALVTLDLVGRLPLPLGVAGHEGSTVLVGLNGLRLLAHRAWSAQD
ncbi:MAG: heavy metal translocating P-type ATPase [Actinobacteria bacterium]|nr:heavy metal translocating P-type ATPase [Actinomycetota bacterium]